MRNQQKLSVAIVGAGIGGLAVAAALRKFFIEPVVYEQADAFARVGAGIQQSPNAVKVHRWLGIEERMRAGRVRAGDLAQPRRALRQGHQRPSARPRGRGALRRALPDACIAATCMTALPSIVPAQNIRLGKKLTQIRERGARVAAHLCRRQRGRGRRRHRRRRRAFARPRPCRRARAAALHRPARLPHHVSGVAAARRRHRRCRAPSGGARTATS